MYAYNPTTGATIEISEYGFQMLSIKGWTRSEDQTPREKPSPIIPPVAPVFNMAEEMEKKRQEVASARKAGEAEINHVPESDTKIVENIKAKKDKSKPKADPGKATGKPKTKTNEAN